MILTRLQTIDATRPTGHGNQAHRRLLSLFEQSSSRGKLQAVDRFRPYWLQLIKSKPGNAEALAYRMAKLSNRPLDKQSPPSWQVCNNWQYEPDTLQRSQRAI